MLFSWFHQSLSRRSRRNGKKPSRAGTERRPEVECLESRTLLSAAPSSTVLVPPALTGSGNIPRHVVKPLDAVLLGTATHLSVSVSENPTLAGGMVASTVTALDGNNSLVAGYAGTVHFSSTDPSAVLPADYTFLPRDNGVHTFDLAFNTAGNPTVSVTDMGANPVTGIASLQVMNPVPAITGIGQSSAAEASLDLTLAVNGTGFVSTSTVLWNGQPLATTFGNMGQLTAIVPAAALAEGGTFSLSVSSPGPGGGTSNSQSFTVVDGALTVTAQTISPLEGTTVSVPVATFTDAGGADASNTYVATIDWGDNTTPTPGTVSPGSNGTFQVTGSHSYAEDGTYPLKVTVQDDGVPATGTSTAMVAESPVTGTVGAIQTTEGAAFSGPVASFTDPGGPEPTYQVAIDWGDNSPLTPGTVSPGLNGTFQVTGSHVYAEEGSFPVKVTLQDDGAISVATGTATAADALLSGSAASLSSVEGTAIKGVVASFTDPDPGAAPSLYQVSINWGDGSRPDTGGQVSAGPGHGYTVLGNHTYTNAGSYTVTVQLQDKGGSVLTLKGAAQVTDAPLRVVGLPISIPLGGTANKVSVAVFADLGPLAPAGNYSASINWGDGTSATTGTLTPTANSTFTISAAHAFTQPGRFSIQVTIRDKGGSSSLVNEPVWVGSANERYIAQLYRGLLGRPVDLPSLGFWVNKLKQGISRKQVALNIEGSLEYEVRLIQSLYHTYLHRAADPSGLNSWEKFLAGGGTDEQLASQIISSPEYFQQRGRKTVPGFLTALYQDVLGKVIDPASQAVFTGELSHGTSRGTVAFQVLTSVQADRLRLRGYFEAFLQQTGSSQLVNKYLQWLQQGKSDDQVIADMVSS